MYLETIIFGGNNIKFQHMALSLPLLPVEMIYRILDHLDTYTILISCQDVCQKLNDVIYTYRRYQVILILVCLVFFQNIFINNHHLNIKTSLTLT